MSATTHTNNGEVGESESGQMIRLDLPLIEAEALHTWLLKATADGASSLDNPQVSATLAELGRAIERVHVIMNVRRELENAGLTTNHLTDDEIRELSRKLAQTHSPGV
jgi:hypothetical protein